MTSFDGYDDEMTAHFDEAILRGEAAGSELGDLIAWIRALGEQPIDRDVIERHVAMLVREAVVSAGAGQVPSVSGRRRVPRARRSIVFSSLLSSILAKVLAASVALAAVGGGVGFVADPAVPGDALYGLDRAFEAVGIGRGGAAERIEEARALAARGEIPEAVATAGEAAEEADRAEAAAALRRAAETIATAGEAAEPTRERVAELLELLATQIEGDGVVGADVAELAGSIAADHGRDRRPVAPPAEPGPPETVPPTAPDQMPGSMPEHGVTQPTVTIPAPASQPSEAPSEGSPSTMPGMPSGRP